MSIGELTGKAGAAPVGIRNQDWLGMAIDLADANVAAGGGPFGAVVVRDDTLVATGANRVTGDFDPTAHAEVMAMRAACVALGDFRLGGTTLYSSCEPCPMCLAAALWARVERVVFAADRHVAAKAGFDDLSFYDVFEKPGTPCPVEVQQVAHLEAESPFQAWSIAVDRIDY